MFKSSSVESEAQPKEKTPADELANGDGDIDSFISAIRHCCFL